MKKHILHLTTILLFGAGLMAVSCGKEDGGMTDQPEPNFPAKVAPTIEAGETYTLEIDPNGNWEIAIPTEGEASKWFWIQDGSQKIYTLRGSAGKRSIVIGTLKEHDFNKDQACEVTMKMKSSNGQELSQVIATIKIGKVTRTLTIRQCKLDEDMFVFNGDLEVPGLTYEYEETPTEEVTLMWPYSNAKGYQMPILVEGNFNWSVVGKLPEWVADMTISTGKVDEQKEIVLLPNLAKLPTVRTEATITFGDKNATFPLKVIIPAYTELFKSEFAVETLYNSNGEFFDDMDACFKVGAAYGRVVGAKDLKFFVFAEVKSGAGASLSNEADATKWVKLADEWDEDINLAHNLAQNRRFEISASPNKTAARRAVVLGVPASVAKTITPEQMVDGNEIAENYRQYIISTLKQLEYFGAIAPKNLLNEMKQSGAVIEKLPVNAPILADFNVTGDAYKLIYTRPDASTASVLMFEKAYTKYECYDFKHQKIESNSWLTVKVPNVKEAPLNVVIEMDPAKDPTSTASQAEGIAHQGYIVFSDAGGNFAVVQCVYDESFEIPLGEPGFLYPTAAAANGSTLVKLTSGAVYDRYKNGDAPVWHLTYTKKNPTMSAIVNLTANVKSTDSDWLEYYYSGASATISINGTLPEEETKKTGSIQIYSDFLKTKLALVLVVTNK